MHAIARCLSLWRTFFLLACWLTGPPACNHLSCPALQGRPRPLINSQTDNLCRSLHCCPHALQGRLVLLINPQCMAHGHVVSLRTLLARPLCPPVCPALCRDGLVLLINPQWVAEGQVVSDLGMLPWQRKANEALVESFQEVGGA